MLVLISLTTIAIVVFATRAALDCRTAMIVEVLHLIGAYDGFIAVQVQRHFLQLALKGGLIGGLAGAITFTALNLADGGHAGGLRRKPDRADQRRLRLQAGQLSAPAPDPAGRHPDLADHRPVRGHAHSERDALTAETCFRRARIPLNDRGVSLKPWSKGTGDPCCFSAHSCSTSCST